jgi:hypothetical protein
VHVGLLFATHGSRSTQYRATGDLSEQTNKQTKTNKQTIKLTARDQRSTEQRATYPNKQTNKQTKTIKQSNSRFAINAVPSDGRLFQLKEQVVVGRREERNLPLEIGRVVVAKKVHLVPGVVCV